MNGNVQNNKKRHYGIAGWGVILSVILLWGFHVKAMEFGGFDVTVGEGEKEELPDGWWEESSGGDEPVTDGPLTDETLTDGLLTEPEDAWSWGNVLPESQPAEEAQENEESFWGIVPEQMPAEEGERAGEPEPIVLPEPAVTTEPTVTAEPAVPAVKLKVFYAKEQCKSSGFPKWRIHTGSPVHVLSFRINGKETVWRRERNLLIAEEKTEETDNLIELLVLYEAGTGIDAALAA